MNEVYIAASFKQRDIVATLGRQLRNKGFGVLDRWTTHAYERGTQYDAFNRAYANTAAREDLNDVLNCDVFVLLVGDPTGSTSFGRYVEFGAALASYSATLIVIVGEPANVFLAMDGRFNDKQIRHVPDWHDVPIVIEEVMNERDEVR